MSFLTPKPSHHVLQFYATMCSTGPAAPVAMQNGHPNPQFGVQTWFAMGSYSFSEEGSLCLHFDLAANQNCKRNWRI